jgi:hypothetical protein
MSRSSAYATLNVNGDWAAERRNWRAFFGRFSERSWKSSCQRTSRPRLARFSAIATRFPPTVA